ncbi:hypothetical protein FQN54_005027 [Arachnomyces sp. PD_36]|nr:hypothetical protein FQN54_005027 [Arachnomyces sp. PD_36]
MPVDMNVFRILGDVSHTVSKCILIWSIHWNRSAEGVSLLTQLLYMAVFITRYLDIFYSESWRILWNITLKFFYILSSIYIVFLMMKVFPRTREKEKGWKLASYGALGSLIGAPIMTAIAHNGFTDRPFTEMFWTFSIILESVCVLPQLLLLRQTSVPTVIDSFYLVTLGSYRGFYILNWIVRAAVEGYFDPVSVLFGIVQTVLYIDFAWVYWTRQRVKLRNGGVVDSDDLRKSWVVGRMLGGRASHSIDEEDRPGDDMREGNGEEDTNGQRYNRWGSRGVSVAADDTLQDYSKQKNSKTGQNERFGDVLEDEHDGEGVESSNARHDDQ